MVALGVQSFRKALALTLSPSHAAEAGCTRPTTPEDPRRSETRLAAFVKRA